jgi:hydroxyacylglutathione hydrolase
VSILSIRPQCRETIRGQSEFAGAVPRFCRRLPRAIDRLAIIRASGHSGRMTDTASQPAMRAAILPVTPLQQNCSLIWCTKTMKGALVDPGGDLDRLKAGVAKAGVTLEKILVTHGHLDHCGMAGVLAKELGLPIEGPEEADRFWIARLDDDAGRWGVEAHTFEPDRWLKDGDTVTVGDLVLDVVHCPGHTPGHVVFVHQPSRFAFVGDVLLKGSIGRTDFPMSDHQSLIDAITQKLWPLGDDITFVPGHGPVSTFGAERQTNPFVADMALKQ